MTFLAATPQSARQAEQQVALTPTDPEGLEPRWWQGSLDATGVALGRVLGITAQVAGEAEYQVGGIFTRPIDDIFGTDITGYLDEELRQKTAQATAAMVPDPYTTGTLGQVLYGIVGVGVPAAVGGYLGGPAGAAIGAGGYQSVGTYTDLTQQGVDQSTAAQVALLEGGLTAAGVGAPAAVGRNVLFNTLAFGPGVNIGQSLVASQGTASILDARGYNELADRYGEVTAESLAADAILGAAFGWGGARSNARMRAAPVESDVDAALAALNRKHAEIDTAPGLPADVAALQSHARNLRAAGESLLSGQPVNVESAGAFVPRHSVADSAVLRAMKEAGIPEIMDDIKALEAELAKRGRVVDSEPLPNLDALMGAVEDGGGRLGRVTDVKIGDEYAAARWAVMEAEQVGATMNLAENQLRDRTRAASTMQVASMAANLDPRLVLTDSPVMDYGPPTMTADGKVIAGNGRAAAIARAYEGAKGAEYRQALAERAGDFGLDPGAVEGMRRPVLVRMLQQSVDVTRAAVLSNEGGAMRMSGLEQARVDAGRLPAMALLDMAEGFDFTAAGARPFLRGWVQQFPTGQQAALVDAAGSLSQEGSMRLRNALLYRAYGDSAVMQRLVESVDPGSRNLAAALVRLSPTVADAKDSIGRGERWPLDISGDVARMADLYERIRDDGLTVDAWFAQLDMFNPGETPVALALLRFVEANKRSAKAIGDMLSRYYEKVEAAGSPGQGDLLGAGPPDAVTLLSNAIAEASPESAAAVVQDTLFRPAVPAEPVRVEAVIRSAERDVDGWGMPAPARALPDDHPLLQGKADDMSPERVAMRDAMIDARFEGKSPATGRPVAIVMGGGGASGKGTVLSMLKAAGKVPDNVVELDPDSFKLGIDRKHGIPEYWDIVAEGDSRAAAVVHAESKAVYDQAMKRAMDGRYNVVLDRTLGKPAQALAELQALRAAGYDIQLVGVTVDPVSAVKRAAIRAEGETKRAVPVADLLSAHKGFASAFEQYAHIADSAILLDNEVPKGKAPKPIIARGAGGELQILDPKAYTQFLEKARLNEKATDPDTLYPGRIDRRGGEVLAGDRPAGDQPRGNGTRGVSETAGPGREGAGRVPGRMTDDGPDGVFFRRPDLAIVKSDGQIAYGADEWSRAAAMVQRAETDAPAFEAAVNCFLRSAT